jgi:hypothetical protein
MGEEESGTGSAWKLVVARVWVGSRGRRHKQCMYMYVNAKRIKERMKKIMCVHARVFKTIQDIII